LIALITQSIEPASWSQTGGPGKIEYYPIGQCLVIIQKPEVQEQIADLLQALRRGQDLEVALETRFISLPKSIVERLGLTGASESTTPWLCCLDDAGLLQLLEAAQSCERSNILQAPKMVLYNGQDGRFDIRQEERIETRAGGVRERVGEEPKCEIVKTGLRLAARPVVSPDRRSVRIHFLAEMSARIPPHTTSGAYPVVVPASINTQRIDQHLTIPDGKTALLYGWRQAAPPVKKERIPVLSYIPYLTELFALAGPPPEDEVVLIAVTPRILVLEEEERAVVLPSATAREALVAELLAKYRKACGEGRLAEARCLGQRALILDPSCFCDHAHP
jgi:type II secretory pathway component GspD/PulD (secretin)